ncbi:hypothetical protein [Nocardioides marmoraquaticus]
MSEQTHPEPDPYQRAEAEAQEQDTDTGSDTSTADDAVTEPGGEGRFDGPTDVVTDGSAARADVEHPEDDAGERPADD